MKTPFKLTWWKVLLGLWGVGAVMYAVNPSAYAPAAPPPPPPAPVAPTPPPVDTAQQRRLGERLAALKRSFNFDKDEVRGGGWYTHQRFYVSTPRPMLWVAVDHEGRAYLISAYRGDSWIFHERIAVRVGDRVLESPVLSGLSPNNRTETLYGGVKEELHFVDGDGGVLGGIAADTMSRIVVRQEGREKYHAFTLNDSDRRAIRESVELGRLIKKIETLRER